MRAFTSSMRGICCAAVLFAAQAFAVDFSSLKPEGYLSDFARVVNGPAKAEIERYCREIEDRTGAQIALVTLPTVEGEPVSDVANLLYRTWGIGQKKSNEGVLLLLVVRDRKSRLEVGYGLEPVLPDGSAGTILRAMRPALRENHYGDAMREAARSIGDRILAAKGATGQVQPPRGAARQRPAESMIPWETVVFVLFVIFLFSMMSRRSMYRQGRGAFPVFFPGMGGGFPGHSGRRGGGGFGGMSDSGGGFGGFGGGDSGGGGASSDW